MLRSSRCLAAGCLLGLTLNAPSYAQSAPAPASLPGSTSPAPSSPDSAGAPPTPTLPSLPSSTASSPTSTASAPLPALPQPLSLAAAVSYALSHSPQVRVAAAQRQMALAKLIPQQPGFHPTVSASASQALQGPTLSIPLPTGPDTVVPSSPHQLALTAQQLLYHPGRKANDARLAAQTASASAAYQDLVSGIAHDVASAWYSLQQAQFGDTIARRAVQEVSQSVAITQSAVAGGSAVALDLLNAQSALSQVQADAATADAGLATAGANLNRLLARPLSATLQLAPADNLPVVPASVDAAITTGLSNRPDLLQRQADLDAARAGVALARGQNGPTVTADAGYYLQTPTALQRSSEWMVRATVQLPLLASAQQRSDVAQARAGVDAAEAGLDAARDGDSLLIFKAWQDLAAARAAVDADSAAVAAAAEALRAARLRLQVHEVTEGDAAQIRLKLEQAASRQNQDTLTVDLRTLDLSYQMGIPIPVGRTGP